MTRVIKGKDILIENVTTLPTGPNKWDGRTVDLWASGTVGTGYPERMIWKESANAWFSIVPQGSVTPDKLSVPSGPTLPLPDECYDGMLFDVVYDDAWNSTLVKSRYICHEGPSGGGATTFQWEAVSGAGRYHPDIYQSSVGYTPPVFFTPPLNPDAYDVYMYDIWMDIFVNFTMHVGSTNYDGPTGLYATTLIEGYGKHNMTVQEGVYTYTHKIPVIQDLFDEMTSQYPGEVAAGFFVDAESTGSFVGGDISFSVPYVTYAAWLPG